jgi:hypothetical protein
MHTSRRGLACTGVGQPVTGRVIGRAASIMCLVAVLLVGGACATGRQTFPTHPSDAPAAIQRATALIADAQAAGADSLAPEAMSSARQHLANAQAERQGQHRDRSPTSARQAAADAVYAKALAQCVTAQRALAAEEAALAAVPVASTTSPNP